MAVPTVRNSGLFKRRVAIHDPGSVTSEAEEVDPKEVGLTRADVDAIWQSVVRYYRLRLHPALSLCVRRHGKVVLNRAIGHSHGNGPDDDGPLILATPETPFNLFSGSKAITAVLVHILVERGLIDLEAPVARYLPEFGVGGKERVTVRHVLSHRAGFPRTPPAAVDLNVLHDRQALLRAMINTELETEPGEEVAYHAVTGGFVLGEIIHRVTGKDARAFLDEAIREPLGFKHLSFGVPAHAVDTVAREAVTGPVAPGLFQRMMRESLGLKFDDAIGMANDPRFLTAIVPSGNVIGTAEEVSRFFELLLRGGELDGTRVFRRGTLERALEPHNSATEVDRIIRLPIRYGLGFMLGGNTLSFYGQNSPNAFGHLGFTNVLAWADPDRDISVALMNNGKPFITPELAVWLRISRVIARRIPRDSVSRFEVSTGRSRRARIRQFVSSKAEKRIRRPLQLLAK